jgi:hypothetical protein
MAAQREAQNPSAGRIAPGAELTPQAIAQHQQRSESEQLTPSTPRESSFGQGHYAGRKAFTMRSQDEDNWDAQSCSSMASSSVVSNFTSSGVLSRREPWTAAMGGTPRSMSGYAPSAASKLLATPRMSMGSTRTAASMSTPRRARETPGPSATSRSSAQTPLASRPSKINAVSNRWRP